MRKKVLILLLIALIACLGGFIFYKNAPQTVKQQETTPAQTEAYAMEQIETPEEAKIEAPVYGQKIDMAKWQYNQQDHVYYQLGLVYCRKPVDADYQKMAVFVPERFFNCNQNADKNTYTCEPNNATSVNGYTIHSAPIVMPVETPKYAAMPALKEYKNVTKFTEAGMVYVYAGCRGIADKAPATVADLKAAVRYLRYNKGNIPANTDLIYVFGVGEGAGLGAILGASGDSALYTPYLKQIGAIESTSDVINGVMAWSPISGIDSANEAYEWSMGFTREEPSPNKQQLSNVMARAYVDYVNNSGFRDENNKPLLLQYSPKGIYRAGTYYDYIKKTIENSLAEFMRDTKFPYTQPRRKYTFGQYSSGKKIIKGEVELSGTYLTRRQYLRALNEKYKWVEYDFNLGVVKIRSVEDFIRGFKPATKEIGAFDGYERQQPENSLFAANDDGVHFDDMTAKVFARTGKADEYAEDLLKQDALGTTVRQRRNMYSPIYYLSPSSMGYRSSKVAKFWRIRSGINQTETPLTTEINLALALYNYPGVIDVNFKTIWAKEHVKAEEKEQNPVDAFIDWVTFTLRNNWLW